MSSNPVANKKVMDQLNDGWEPFAVLPIQSEVAGHTVGGLGMGAHFAISGISTCTVQMYFRRRFRAET